jgi:HAE1 family hydrophobic/amphiphilic exporter-1
MDSSSPIDIEIKSANPQAAMETAESIRNILLKMPLIQDPLISLESGGPQLRISIDRERAAVLGVSTKAIAGQIKTAVSGSTVTTISDNGEEISVRLRLKEEEISDLPDLEALFLTNSSGDRIPLSSVASIYETRSPADIDRENQQRIIHVTSDLAEGVAATEMQGVVQSAVEANLVPVGDVDIIYSGEAQDIRRFGGSFLIIIVAAIVLVFGVMASQFESFVDPFIIFFSIPLLFIGVIWIYKITGEPFSLFSAVGVVALVGIVVNNGIVLVDYTNTLRSRGMKVREACIAAGVNRLQPILMTTLTTILGMTPLAFFPGEGAETIQPIAKTIVGGLTVSAVMTLFVTPVMYSVLNRRHDIRLEKSRGRLDAMEAKYDAL